MLKIGTILTHSEPIAVVIDYEGAGRSMKLFGAVKVVMMSAICDLHFSVYLTQGRNCRIMIFLAKVRHPVVQPTICSLGYGQISFSETGMGSN
jgi:hypothetical protein